MLVAVDPASRLVVISSQLAGSHYQHLSGVRLTEPRLAQQRPAAEILQHVWQTFTAQEAGHDPRIDPSPLAASAAGAARADGLRPPFKQRTTSSGVDDVAL